jgi:penicillin-binding protein 2
MYRLAEENRTQTIALAAPRGRILDRNGDVILDNAPRFSLFYSNLSVDQKESLRVESDLADMFSEDASLIHKRIAQARRTGKMSRLVAGLPREKALGLIERRMILPGVQVLVEPQRRGRYGSMASHVLGYVDEITPKDLRSAQDDRFRAGQFVGRMGVERLYDRFLRGTDGGLQFEMDARGRHLKVLQRLPPVPGNDVVLTLDRVLQAAAERGLDATITGRGAVVAVDPRSGAVLALVSHPSFDPAGDMAALLSDPMLPLFNRAVQGSYPPGSVFKSITAMAALEKGWNIKRKILCPGVFKLGNKEFKCWKKHGVMDFIGAMSWSCDVYHYVMGLEAGVDALEVLGRDVGLGEKSGIDLTSEAAGNLPGRVWKKKAMREPWFDGDTVNMSIGQGFVTVTPLQAAMLMATISNGGTLWRPRIVDRVMDSSGKEVYRSLPQIRRQWNVPADVAATVRGSLEAVVRGGTGGQAFRPDLIIGGKTGTAQNPHGEDHAWFAAYAGRPGEAASIALVGFVENGGHGAAVALPVVREVLNAAFPVPVPAPRHALVQGDHG